MAIAGMHASTTGLYNVATGHIRGTENPKSLHQLPLLARCMGRGMKELRGKWAMRALGSVKYLRYYYAVFFKYLQIPPDYPIHPHQLLGSSDFFLKQAKFYIAIAAIPLAFAAYKYSTTPSTTDPTTSPTDTRPYLTRFINRFRGWDDEFERRNATHTAMLDVAARDRNLFYNAPRKAARELANPE